MSVVIAAPPARFRVHRAPLLDPPFDDELSGAIYRPVVLAPATTVPPSPAASVSPECSTAALRFLNVCLELFNGFRSPRQLLPLLHVEHAHHVLDEMAKTSRHLNELRRRHHGARVRRCGLRSCEPRPGAIEVAAVLSDGARNWAMCYRLEGRGSAWRCTYLRSILPAAPHPRRR